MPVGFSDCFPFTAQGTVLPELNWEVSSEFGIAKIFPADHTPRR
jgi:hypothetical protein